MRTITNFDPILDTFEILILPKSSFLDEKNSVQSNYAHINIYKSSAVCEACTQLHMQNLLLNNVAINYHANYFETLIQQFLF